MMICYYRKDCPQLIPGGPSRKSVQRNRENDPDFVKESIADKHADKTTQ